MSADPKKIDFQSKNDLIIFFNLIIELTTKHFYRYKVYYDELLNLATEQISKISGIKKENITEVNIAENIRKCTETNKYRNNHENLKYSYLEYKSIEDKISNVQGQILNLLGDRTSKGGVSYWRFRDEYNKMIMKKQIVLPPLMEFSDEFNKTLNDLYKARNYSHHMTDAKFIEWKNYRENQLMETGYKLFQVWPSEIIEIDRYEYVSIEWIWQLLLAQIDFKRDVKKVLMQMKKDYSSLYGKSIRTNTKWIDILDCSNFEISINGYKRHLGKIQ